MRRIGVALTALLTGLGPAQAAQADIGFARTDFPITGGVAAVAVADLDGNGRLDVATGMNNAVANVLLGDGAGALGAPTFYNVGGASTAVATGDFTGDGATDIATAHSNSVWMLRRIGGGFAPGVSFPVAGNPVSMVAADFDGDGDGAIPASSFASRLSKGARPL